MDTDNNMWKELCSKRASKLDTSSRCVACICMDGEQHCLPSIDHTILDMCIEHNSDMEDMSIDFLGTFMKRE